MTWVKGQRVKGFPSVELLRQVQSVYIVWRIKNEGLAFCCCPGSIYFVRGVWGNIALYIMQWSEGRSKSHTMGWFPKPALRQGFAGTCRAWLCRVGAV